MTNQLFPCSIATICQDLPRWDISSESLDNESQEQWPNSYWTQFEAPNPYFGGLGTSQTVFNNQMSDFRQIDASGNCLMNGLCNATEDVSSFNCQEFYGRPIKFENGIESPCHPLLQYRVPTVTSYGAVTILLRHLIRVDVSFSGSVSIYNYPSMSITTMSANEDKCYIQHPNGRIYQNGADIHVVIGTNRFVKINERGVLFSTSPKGIAYLIDESGTKTTNSASKFMNLDNELVMDVFFEGNSHNIHCKEIHKMAQAATNRAHADGSETWNIGMVRIYQNCYGGVTVSKKSGKSKVLTSPTVRSMRIENESFTANIDCYSNKYFSLRKGSCSITSGFSGLTVRNGSQKAGLNSQGKLVLL